MKLILPRALQARIEALACDAFPAECCGLMEGIADAEQVRVLVLHPARNVASAPDRFEIHPEDHFAALRAARANGHAIVGCYHSHPGGMARPSETDRQGGGEENFVWLIAALAGPGGAASVAAFVYSAPSFLPLDLATPAGAGFIASLE
jgi:proteasome lid subunit RPN8/RPN11